MLVFNFIFSTLYLRAAESFRGIPKSISNNDLIESTRQVLCSTESYVIHLLTSNREEKDSLGQLIEHQSEDCNLRPMILIEVNERTKISFQYKSTVTVFIVSSQDKIRHFLKTVTRNGGGNNNQKFLFVLNFECDRTVAVKIFESLINKYFRNIAVIMYEASVVSLLIHNPFLGRNLSVRDTIDSLSRNKDDIFLFEWRDIRGHSLVISMYEQYDRAIAKNIGRFGYIGVDGLIADLVEERYMNLYAFD